MIIDILWLLFGLVLILFGANALTDGSASLARRMGLSDLVVGLTVVAFGTSAPEVVISLLAGLNGNAPMAVGNVVGSNTFSFLAIIGATALVRPIVVGTDVRAKEIPMAVLSSIILLVLGNSALINGGGINEVTRVDGILLLILFVLFLWFTVVRAKQTESIDSEEVKTVPLWRAIAFVIGGLAALIWGGDRFVDGAAGIASSLGMSDALIGLTIVAVGTSLPELATSIVAAVKGRPGLAVGNVIGSVIFNVLMVLGLTAAITPLPFGDVGNFDLLTLVGGSFLFLLFGWIIRGRTITRLEGAILLAAYIAYTVVLIL